MQQLQLTLDELAKVQQDELEKLIEQVGGMNHLSKMLNVSYMVVKGWNDRGRISKGGAKLVEEHGSLGEYFKAKTLRPDL